MGSLIRTCASLESFAKSSYVKDIFNISYYVGNNDNSIIVNGLNMTNGHFLTKIKNRNNIFNHVVYDTIRGSTKELYTNKPSSENVNVNGLKSFTNRGFVLGNSRNVNTFADNYVVTTIKKTEKFFDIVEYIGDGTIHRSINHNLNCDIGMISIKAIDIYNSWIVRHKDAVGELFGEQSYLQNKDFTQITEINNLYFKVSNNANLLGVHYVAYIYAHDSSSAGKIQCGSYTGGYQEVINTITGIGNFFIPDDVDTITITCKGGTGGSNVWYDPGQPFVPEVKEQKLIPPTYGWEYTDDYSMTTVSITNVEIWDSYDHVKPLQPSALPTAISDPNDPITSVYVEWWSGTMDNPVFYKGHYSSYLVDVGQEFTAGVPEQVFKAPTSGGDVYTGNFSKVIVDGYTYVFEGGNGGPATPQIKNILLNTGINRKLSFNIAPGGNLIYSYKTGGVTDITLKYSLPSSNFEVELKSKGSIDIPRNVKQVVVKCSGGLGSNDTYISKGQPLIEPTYIVKGQPKIDANPGQPYIAPITEIIGQGNVAYLNGLLPYVAGVTGIPSTPEKITSAGWRFKLTNISEAEFILNTGFPSIYFNDIPGDPSIVFYPMGFYDSNNNVILDSNGYPIIDWLGVNPPTNAILPSKEILGTDGNRIYFRYFYKKPPGTILYLANKIVGTNNFTDTSIPFSVAPLTMTTRRITMYWTDGRGASGSENFNSTYFQTEIIPEVIGVGGIQQQGNSSFPDGLPKYIASRAANPGQSYIAPTIGQPYIETIYKDRGQPYIAPVYLNPGQPYIAPTPYDPGQPKIDAVAGQEYIAAQAAVSQVGFPEYKDGLPIYVAGVTSVPSKPETVILAGWRYDKYGVWADSFFTLRGITSKYLSIDLLNYDERIDLVTKRWYRIYAHQPPGSDYYFTTDANGVAVPLNVEVAGKRSTATSVIFTCRYYYQEGTGSVTEYKNMDLTWYEKEIIPGVVGTTGVTQKGLPAYLQGLPKYIPGKVVVVGQPYIASVTGQPYIAPIPSSSGQPYLPPIIGVGDIIGESSFVSLNNQTFTFPGAMGWDTPVSITNIITLKSDSLQSLVYNVASTGNLNISYDIPNFDTTTKPDFKPYYLLIKKITGNGDWIEIDARRPLFNLKLNKSDVEVMNEVITFKDDGFIPNSILINELNEKYIYMVIRK